MFDLNKEWSISFAGCGFMGIYYVGVISCILGRFPRFIQDASKIYGASAGALMAAIITLGIPLDLISSESPLRGLPTNTTKRACCEQVKDSPEGEKSDQRDHPWLNPKLIQNLPSDLQRVLCKACNDTHTAGGLLTHITEYLPKKVTSYLPFDSARSVAQRVRGWIPDVPRDMRWLFGIDANKQPLKKKLEYKTSQPRLRRCSSLPSDLHLCESEEERNPFLESPVDAHSSTSASSGTDESPGRGLGLGRALGLLRNLGSEQTSGPK